MSEQTTCTECNGRGYIFDPECNGNDKDFYIECPFCKGTGIMSEPIKINVPSGMRAVWDAEKSEVSFEDHPVAKRLEVGNEVVLRGRVVDVDNGAVPYHIEFVGATTSKDYPIRVWFTRDIEPFKVPESGVKNDTSER